MKYIFFLILYIFSCIIKEKFFCPPLVPGVFAACLNFSLNCVSKTLHQGERLFLSPDQTNQSSTDRQLREKLLQRSLAEDRWRISLHAKLHASSLITS